MKTNKIHKRFLRFTLICVYFCHYQASIPFAVVGSNTVVEAGGKKIRGRMYPWGIVEGKNYA